MRINPWKISSLALAGALTFTLATMSMPEADADGQKQPQMHAALADLRDARDHLQAATSDKGGHRAKALALTKEAIDQVEKGIAYDQNH
jgi:hypothetical protein